MSNYSIMSRMRHKVNFLVEYNWFELLRLDTQSTLVFNYRWQENLMNSFFFQGC